MAVHQASPSLGFSRQEHWSGLSFTSPMMKVKSEREIVQSCLTLHYSMDCSLPDSSIHGIFQARILEWGAIAFSTSPPGHIYLLPPSSLLCGTPWTSLSVPDCGEQIRNWLLARYSCPFWFPLFSSWLPLTPSSFLHVTLWTSLGVPHCGESFHH